MECDAATACFMAECDMTTAGFLAAGLKPGTGVAAGRIGGAEPLLAGAAEAAALPMGGPVNAITAAMPAAQATAPAATTLKKR